MCTVSSFTEHLDCQGLTGQCLETPLPSRRAPLPPQHFVSANAMIGDVTQASRQMIL